MAIPKYRNAYHAFEDNEDRDWDDDDDMDDEPDHPWRRANDLQGKYIGVELELEAANSKSYQFILQAMPEHDEHNDGPSPEVEQDGSIDDYSGIEIIFPPVRPHNLRSKAGYFRRAVEALDASGVVACSEACGMHMNVNTNGWVVGKMAIFSAMINCAMPQKVLEKMGGRKLNDYCSQYREEWRRVHQYSHTPGDSHDWACEQKGSRMECRFPAATTNMDDIIRISYFLEYLEEFAEAHGGTEWKDTFKSYKGMYTAFLQWLNEQENEHATGIANFLTEA
jgi:hypothetical protein